MLGDSTHVTTRDTPMRYSSLQVTRVAAVIGCVFFLPAIGFSPLPGSSLGMPWPVFFFTWGVMLLAASVCLLGYIACRSTGEPISNFYVICPVLLFGAFLVVLYLRDIVRALSS